MSPSPSPVPGASPATAVRGAAARGAVLSAGGYALAQVLRLAGNLALTRLLLEEAFGLMALIAVVLAGLQLFSDLGINASIVASERGDDARFLDTAWTVQALRGLALFLATCAAAAPFARFYGDARLAAALPVAGLGVFVAGLASTKLASASRHLALGRVVALELASQVLGLTLMIAWAALSPSVWALVAGGLASAAAKTLGSHLLLPGRGGRLGWSGECARALLRFGRWIFVSTLMTFLAGQSDRLVFGKLVPLDVLGVYSVAAMLAALPTSAIGHLCLSVVFPALARVSRAGEAAFAAAFARARGALLALGGWSVAGLVAGGPTLVRLAYDERYREAGWILRLLAAGSWFAALEATNGAALLARGRAERVAAAGAGKVLAMLVSIPLGYALAGFPGAVAGFAAAELAKYAVSAAMLAGIGLSSVRQDLVLGAQVAGSAAAGALAVALLERVDAPVPATAALLFALVSALWAPRLLGALRELRGGRAEPAGAGAGAPGGTGDGTPEELVAR